MNVLRHTERGFADKLGTMARQSSLFDATIEERTRVILEEVRTRGDTALVELTERFDRARITAGQLPVTPVEWRAASAHADEALRAAVETTRKNVEFFGRQSLRKN